MNKIKQFLQGAVSEFRQVTWPTKDQLRNHTILVIIFVAVFAAFIALIDLIFATGFSYVTKNVPRTQTEDVTRTSTTEAVREPVTGETAAPIDVPQGIEIIDEAGNPVEGVTVSPVTE